MVAIRKGTLGYSQSSRRTRVKYDKEKLSLAALGLILVVWIGYYATTFSPPHKFIRARETAASKKRLPALSDSHNAVAKDIVQILDCESLLNATTNSDRRRRLDESAEDEDPGEEGQFSGIDDDAFAGGDYTYMTAKHLFCVAATPDFTTDGIHCDASHSKRQTLLDLWSTARAQMPQVDILVKTLEAATERAQTLVGHDVYLWAPSEDQGVDYMLSELNNIQDDEESAANPIHHLGDSLGPDHLFVDVGSCLGLTSMAVKLLYPGTDVVSIEPAHPNWLLQELNLRCNDIEAQPPPMVVLLAGVGHTKTPSMAKLMWRPQATTSTRAWTPSNEHMDTDIELTVGLRPLNSLLAEAGVHGRKIDVLNVDCEGCEYNLLPSLEDTELEDIPTIMGGLHWGYIPTDKLPSSGRAKLTHERMCVHEHIAKTAKECCAFPNMEVKSLHQGEVLVQDTERFPPKTSTVADVAGELCNGFDEWAEEHHLHDVEDDYGWFELTSMAA